METLLNPLQLCCPVSDATHVAAARRAAAELAAQAGLDPVRAGELAIVVTEAASNILKHAGHGEILLRPLYAHGRAGVEVLALDGGPGMASLAVSLQDGRTTAGSYGVGLGAMQRLSSGFDAYSAPGQGTAIWLAIWQQRQPVSGQPGDGPPAMALEVGAVCLPMRGETVCGDAWALACGATSATVLVADGLGHGPLAADASRAAVHTAMAAPEQPASVLLEDMHGALRATRGAAAAVVRIDMLAGGLQLAGIGNIACHAWSGGTRRQLVSHNGIVGSNMRKVQEFPAPWGHDSMLILHSDGLGSRWNLDDYPGLAARHPAVVAAVLYRDFSRRSDDVTVLVLRDRQGGLA
ncbi:ATP-binding protein [Pseudoduganella sp. UC29_71]|jgi:anti-sigma regulatory factor (Ser/Thr protein kinase)|uniref:ATP-binding protein n=1 Tax=Pseudoduganella sp. UC29_71 TaxID=3350174 RepID=UPI00366B1EE5